MPQQRHQRGIRPEKPPSKKPSLILLRENMLYNSFFGNCLCFTNYKSLTKYGFTIHFFVIAYVLQILRIRRKMLYNSDLLCNCLCITNYKSSMKIVLTIQYLLYNCLCFTIEFGKLFYNSVFAL